MPDGTSCSSRKMPGKADGAGPGILTGCTAEVEAWKPSLKILWVWLLKLVAGGGCSYPEVRSDLFLRPASITLVCGIIVHIDSAACAMADQRAVLTSLRAALRLIYLPMPYLPSNACTRLVYWYGWSEDGGLRWRLVSHLYQVYFPNELMIRTPFRIFVSAIHSSICVRRTVLSRSALLNCRKGPS